MDRRKALRNVSEHAGDIPQLGWCYRLPSGVPEAEEDNNIRGKMRDQGIELLLQKAEE